MSDLQPYVDGTPAPSGSKENERADWDSSGGSPVRHRILCDTADHHGTRVALSIAVLGSRLREALRRG